MRRARKVLALSWRERWLLARAVVIVAAIRLGLSLLPYRILAPLLARLSPAPTGEAPAGRHEPDRVAWAVRAAARYIPRATCMTQALAAQHLLARCGEPSEIHIGAAYDTGRGVTAHAWLAAGGKVIIGAETMDRYLPLTWLTRRGA
jgi:hypothetical protein